MMSTRRSPLLNFTAPLVLEPPRHCGLSAIALVPGRHLIGTSEDCAIRVNVDGVMDRHAIILVGENRTVVKSIDARTWVNDGPVAEMALRSGDRLSIGPLTFRIRSATREEAAVFHSALQLVPAEQVDAVVPEVPAPVVNVPAPAVVATVEPTSVPVAVVETEPIVQPVQEPEVVTIPSELAPEVQTTTHTDRGLIDSRLNELEKRLVELQHATVAPQPATHLRENEVAAESAEVTRHFDLRHEELQRRSEQIAIEARRVQERADYVAKREAHVERRRHELTQEAERLATTTNSVREALSNEHALHLKTWQEWDATYVRLTNDLNARFELLETQQAALHIETERINSARLELQRARSEYDQLTHGLAEVQQKLANDRAELSVLKSRVEAQQKQLLREADELDSRRQLDLLEISRRQAELLTEQQELESERQAILAERTTHLHRLDQENQRRVSLQEMFEKDRQLAATERDELLRLKNELERTRSELELERSRVHVVHDQSHDTRGETEDLRSRCQAAEQELAQLRSQWDEFQSRQHNFESPVASAEVQPEALFEQQFPIAEPLSIDSTEVVDHVFEPSSAKSAGEVPQSSYVPEVFPRPESSHPSESRFAPWGIAAVSESDVSAVMPPEPLSSSADNAETTEDFANSIDWAALHSLHHNFEGGSSTGVSSRGHAADADYSYRSPLGPEAAYIPPPGDLSAWPIPESKLGTNPPVVFGTDPWANVSASFESTPSRFNDVPSGKFDYSQAVDPWATPLNTESRIASDIENSAIGSQQFEGAFPAPYSTTIEPTENPAGFEILDQLMARQSAPSDHVDETIAAINRDFGVPIDSPQELASESALPAWWNQQPSRVEELSPVEAGHPDWVVDALRSSPGETLSPDAEAPASDLRSQLAMLFDLPASALDEKAKELPALGEQERSTPQVETSSIRDEAVSAPEPVSKVESPVAAVTSQESASSASDDSVEEFMARLLARSRGNAVDMEAKADSKSSTPSVPNSSLPQSDSVPVTELQSTDRSHLMAEPKHKQNKQEVRENLQSFRQVAHLSARSALAKYSHQQLLNATIAKGVLFGISAISTGVFLVDPLWGNAFQLWKAGACFLATVLSGMETRRSWMQLRGPLGGVPVHAESHHTDESGPRSHDVRAASAARVTTASEGAATSNNVSSVSE